MISIFPGCFAASKTASDRIVSVVSWFMVFGNFHGKQVKAVYIFQRL